MIVVVRRYVSRFQKKVPGKRVSEVISANGMRRSNVRDVESLPKVMIYFRGRLIVGRFILEPCVAVHGQAKDNPFGLNTDGCQHSQKD